MQITSEVVTILLSVLGSIVVVAVSWGLMQGSMTALKEKVLELRTDIERVKTSLENAHAQFVTKETFFQVIEPIHRQLNGIQGDVKDLIRLVSKTERSRE